MLITDQIVGKDLGEVEIAGRSLWKDARQRYMRNKAAVFFTVVLILIALFTVLGPLIAVTDYETIDFSMIGQAAEKGQPSIANGHYFGYDDEGRDLYSRVIQGTWISMLVGVVGAAVAVVIGTLYGAIAGYFGGRVDSIMMRIVDILMAIPFMFVLILLLVAFERSVTMLFVGIGMLSWLGMARIVRGQTISIRNKEFIEAAQVSGVGSFTIILRHIVPNLLGVVTVYATLLVPEMILTESFISFVGLGVQPPDTSLGQLINVGAGNLQYGTIWQLLFPLGFFVVLIFSLFFVGDGLRDALDPKDR
ncbi:ABC transporter permease subunit [Abyssibius alkaniclasticus]|uniref:ABC transporter permease subunit n=1 Tax=Abyssibius alkaniclasticus TaxID=2881234 RepID=UPI0023639379|nr:ABC transporter permease subunit [Abyssibius alkaniclasticus]UPH70990.1 ABC transporter permease subunit [Abyssibius alkaniclasticus]